MREQKDAGKGEEIDLCLRERRVLRDKRVGE